MYGLNGFLGRIYDMESFNRITSNFYDIEGYRDRYDNVEDNSVTDDMKTMIDLLAKYIDAENAPFTIIPEYSSKRVDPDEEEYKMSMIIPKRRAGIEFWNSYVKHLSDESIKNKLMLHYTPSGYKTLDMFSKSDKLLMENESVKSLLSELEESGESFNTI